MRWVVDPFGALRMSKQNGAILAGFDVDNSVFLIDRKMSRQRSMLFSGPSGGTHEAIWLWNDGFVVAGFGGGPPHGSGGGGPPPPTNPHFFRTPPQHIPPHSPTV